ncbi:MAG: DNA mismatch repair endonuclease MutL, partial [Patescibacteria group bacterium]|nr:DNA mismatch repair endonuclease MutL [Patescibacteria group bacterium]
MKQRLPMTFGNSRTASLPMLLAVLLLTRALRAPDESEQPAPRGWSQASPRDEIRPEFAYLPGGGPEANGSFVIEAGSREGAMGWWEKTFDVQGGRWYRFTALRKTANVETPRRTAVARILWRDADNRPVLRQQPTTASYLPGEFPPAQPEFPADGQANAAGWTEVSGVYLAPPAATGAIVELSYRWEAGGRVEWSAVAFEASEPLPARTVRLATVHLCPREGKTAEEKCRQFAPLIAEAARQRADLVVLPETLTSRIAAGEVVESPASIVKELLENALDAGATEIAVELEKGGCQSIRVTDNGEGIGREEVALAFARYATSKIGTFEDIYRDSSFGFRGEALPSIASISRVEMVTRQASSPAGTRIVVEGGEERGLTDAGCPVGTS